MKKRYVFILVFFLIVLMAVFRLLKIGSSLIADNVSFTNVEKGSFRQEYQTSATISGIKHYYYYNGLITDCSHEVNDFINNDEVLLTYLNSENRKTDLKSTVSGYITELSGNRVTVCDLDYRLICYLPADKFDLLKDETECLFEYGKNTYSAKIISRKDMGEKRAGQTVYQVMLKPDNQENLKLNRQGNLIIPLETVSNVLKVDCRAVLEDTEGCYLLDADWINDMDHPEKYRINIEVLMADDSTAVIGGAGLENRRVCIMNDDLKAVLHD